MTKNPEDLGYETSTEAMAPDFQHLSLFDTGWKLTPPHPPPAHCTFNIKFATAARQSWSVACGSERQFVCLFFGFFPSPNSFLSETEIGF